MISKTFYFLLAILFLTISCDNGYDFKLEIPKNITLNQQVKVTLLELNNQAIDSVHFYIDGKKITNEALTTATFNTATIGIGKHAISALVFYPKNSKKINQSFEILSDITPSIYNFKIVHTYPHDSKAYTQGLEYYNGYLYESTGKRGQSSLRKVEIETGKILQKIELDKSYFGEGITIFNDSIYMLTWQGKKGFVFDLKTFTKGREFTYGNSVEGWGFTNNGKELIKSDGTNKIWFLDPTTLKEKRYLEVYTNKYAVDNLNELELIGNQLFANKYQQNAIVIIDINTGAITGVADLTDLKKEVEKTQKLVPEDEVLNGIAFDKQNNRLFVTGKNWNKLFEIELVKKQ